MAAPTTLKVGDRVYAELNGRRHDGEVAFVEDSEGYYSLQASTLDSEEWEQAASVKFDYGETVVIGLSRLHRIEER